MRSILLFCSAILPIISSWTYIVAIWKGSVSPQRMTRFLMLIISGLSFGSLLAGDDHSGIWLALASFVQSLAIVMLTFRHGMGGRDRLDMVCLLLCGIGIVLWMTFDESLIGLIASLVADLIACIPS